MLARAYSARLPLLWLGNDGRLDYFGILEAMGGGNITVFCFKFIYYACVQSVRRAGLDTDGFFAVCPSLDAEVALLHSGFLLIGKLW